MKKANKDRNTTEQMKNKILMWVNEAQKRYFLHGWTISVEWDCSNTDAAMIADSRPTYRKATIEVDADYCRKTCSDEEVRYICYHEMAHVLHSEYSALAHARYINEEQLDTAEEQFAQIIAKIALSK